MTADREALSGEIARVLGRHCLARPYGEKAAWCVCLTWSIDQTTDRLADEHAYEAHLADALADLLAARDRRVRGEALREAADFCEPVIADALGSGRDDFSDGWREASGQILAELRDRADRIEADR